MNKKNQWIASKVGQGSRIDARRRLLVNLVVSFFLILCVGVRVGLGITSPQEKVKKENLPSSEVKITTERIVHLDLFPSPKKRFQTPVRNIFLPSLRGITNRDIQGGTSLTSQQGASSGGEGTLDVSQAESTSGWNIFLEYVGYIKSSGEIVALILYQNQPWVVRAGDVLDDGSVVSAISEETVEIIGPNKEKKIFRFIEEKP